MDKLVNTKLAEKPDTSEWLCWQFTPEHVNDYWYLVQPFIVRWLKAGNSPDMEEADVFTQAAHGLIQIFVFHTNDTPKLVMLTEFRVYPQGKWLNFLGIVGETPIKALKYCQSIEHWARENGAVGLESLADNRKIGALMRKCWKLHEVGVKFRRRFDTLH